MLIYTSRLLQPHVFLFFLHFHFVVFSACMGIRNLPDLTFTFTHASAANDRFFVFYLSSFLFLLTTLLGHYMGNTRGLKDVQLTKRVLGYGLRK